MIPRLQDVTNDPDEEVEEIDLDARQNFFDSLSIVTQCHVCMDENKRGFVLGCDHEMCTDCTRNLFLAAVRDSSLLPLRCCEVPIDMNMCRHLITTDEVRTLMSRVAELEATNKMYCPTCNKFINLDLVDAQESTDLLCVCETALCVSCKTVAHPRFTCEENQAIVAGDDTLLLEHARTQGWKQCPNCSEVSSTITLHAQAAVLSFVSPACQPGEATSVQQDDVRYGMKAVSLLLVRLVLMQKIMLGSAHFLLHTAKNVSSEL